MAPLRGWAPVGQRLHAKVPYGHWKTMTFIAALRCDRIEAPLFLISPSTRSASSRGSSSSCAQHAEVPSIVIMDNLSSHKKPAIRAAIGPRAQGYCSFRPPALTSIRSSRSLPSLSTS